MLEALDSDELNEWAAYFELQEDLEDYRAGTVAAAVMNAARAKRKGKSGRWRAVDFFPQLRRWEVGAPPSQSAEGQVEAVKMLAAAFGGRFTPGGGASA